MDRTGRFVPIILCIIVAVLQLRLAVHCTTLVRSWEDRSKQEVLFDLGAFIFLMGIQALLLRSFLGLTSGNGWIALALISGMAIVLLGISLNIVSLLRRK